VHDLREIEQPLAVTVHDFPTQALCKRLGLVGTKLSEDPSGIAWELEPVRPFWARVTMTEDLGEQLLWRSAGAWQRPDEKEKIKSYLDDENIKVGSGLVVSLEVGDPRRLQQATQDFESKIRGLPEARRRVKRALKAAEEELQDLKEKKPSDVEGVDAKLKEAQDELDHLKATQATEENIQAAQRKVDDLKAIKRAQRKVDDLRAADDNITGLKEKQSALEKAEGKLDKAKRDLAKAQAEHDQANATLNAKNAALKDVEDGKDVQDGKTKITANEAKAAVEEARGVFERAKAKLGRAKPKLTERQRNFETAQTNFETAQAKLAEPAVANLAAARAKLEGLEEEFLTRAEAKNAIKAVDPQVVIETILSREWGNWDTRARWRKGLTDIRERHSKAVEWQGRNQYEAEYAFFNRYETGVYALPRLKDFLNTALDDDRKLLDLAKDMKEQYLKLTEREIRMTENQTNLLADGLWELTPTRRSPAMHFYKPIVGFLNAIRAFDRTKLIAPGDTRRNNEYLNETAKEAGALLDALYLCNEEQSFRYLVKRIRGETDAATQQTGQLAEYQLPGSGPIDLTEERPPRTRTEEQLLENARDNRQVLYETVRWPSVRKSLDDEANRMRARCKAQREALFTLLSGAWVKPDFVVRRDTAGSTRDQEGTTRRDWIFPLAESWDEEWYAGLLQQEPPLPSTA
jgi:hypothetical protein